MGQEKGKAVGGGSLSADWRAIIRGPGSGAYRGGLLYDVAISCAYIHEDKVFFSG